MTGQILGRLSCLVGLHDFEALTGVAYDGEELKTGVEVCSRCQKDRVNELLLAFFQMECNAQVVPSGEQYARPSAELMQWVDDRLERR